jgi:hypothetical protein
MNKPLEVVITYKNVTYRDIITNYKILDDNYTTILPKYKGCRYYSFDYFRRLTQDTIKWEDLKWLQK